MLQKSLPSPSHHQTAPGARQLISKKGIEIPEHPLNLFSKCTQLQHLEDVLDCFLISEQAAEAAWKCNKCGELATRDLRDHKQHNIHKRGISVLGDVAPSSARGEKSQSDGTNLAALVSQHNALD